MSYRNDIWLLKGASEWVAFYVDGVLISENHSADLEGYMFKLAGLQIGDVTEIIVNDDYLEKRLGGSFGSGFKIETIPDEWIVWKQVNGKIVKSYNDDVARREIEDDEDEEDGWFS